MRRALQAQTNQNIRAPGVLYHAVVLTGLGMSLTALASTFLLLNKITGPEVAPHE